MKRKREREMKGKERRRRCRAGGRSLFLLATFIGGLAIVRKKVCERVKNKKEEGIGERSKGCRVRQSSDSFCFDSHCFSTDGGVRRSQDEARRK